VWLAECIHNPGRNYALKFSLHPPGAPRRADERAEREVRLLLQVAHPNVVRVIAHGRYKDPQHGLRYLVMDWVEGATLLVWARRHNPPLSKLVRLFQKIVQAVQAAHEAGVVHRDLKPNNVLVREADDEPFMGDLGAGDAAGGPTLTQPGLPPGTPAFRSPEAWAFARRGGAAPYVFQPADDWYALGVTLYVLLTEVLPFPDMLAGEGLEQWVARRRPVPPHLLNPRVPRALSRVVMRLLAKQPHQRYRDGHTLCAALAQALAVRADWEAPVYPHAPAGPAAAANAAPMPGSSVDGAEEDPRAQLQRLLQPEDDAEAQRREAVLCRRNELLLAQPRVWPLSWRQVAVAAVLLALAAVTWPAWVRVSARLATSQPAVAPTTGVAPPAPDAPDTAPPFCPSPAPAPWEQLPLTSPPPPPTVASTDANSLKEDSPVKKGQSSNSAQPTAVARATSPARAARTALCALGAAVNTACPAVPTHSQPAECSSASVSSMDRLGIETGTSWEILVEPNEDSYDNPITLSVGPIASLTLGENGEFPKGTRLWGRVLPTPGEEVIIHYTELQVPGKERHPICAVVEGVWKDRGNAERFEANRNTGFAYFVLTFPK
jgi:eukaryotic-like serine/threonine-protein kinase